MIKNFGDAKTEKLYNEGKAKGFPPSLVTVALRKLDMLRRASILQDLKAPPGNRLEALKGSLKGFHSIRINDQWRIIFRWNQGSVEDVQITDYH